MTQRMRNDWRRNQDKNSLWMEWKSQSSCLNSCCIHSSEPREWPGGKTNDKRRKEEKTEKKTEMSVWTQERNQVMRVIKRTFSEECFAFAFQSLENPEADILPGFNPNRTKTSFLFFGGQRNPWVWYRAGRTTFKIRLKCFPCFTSSPLTFLCWRNQIKFSTAFSWRETQGNWKHTAWLSSKD